VLLGTTTAESSRLYGLTVTEGDPAWAGQLAGVSLRLPVFHVTEPEIKRQIDPKIYESEIALTEMAIEVEKISQAMQEVRSRIGL
jgi:betaine reductase